MTLFALLARIVLCSIFLLGSWAKLVDLKGSRKAITDFGLPAWSAKSLGLAIPLAELAVAILLVPVATVGAGAFGALLLLIAFTLAIAINVALGRTPDCHCFGQVHSKPIGLLTLARSCLLAGLAGFLAWHAQLHEEYGVGRAIDQLTAAQVLGALFGALLISAVGALFWLVLHLFRQNGRLLLRIEALEAGQQVTQKQIPSRPVFHGLPVGAQAVTFDLPIVSGGRATLASFLRSGKPILLISTNPNCGPCNTLMPDVAAWQKTLVDELTIVLLSHGRLDDNRAKAEEHGLSNVLVSPDYNVAEKYQAVGTPTGILIRNDGTIGSPAMGGPDAIRQLVNLKAWMEPGFAALTKTLGQPSPSPPAPPALPVGSMAPVFALQDLNGNTISAGAFNGSKTVLLFWNTGCGFCQRMLPQLKEWESRKPPNAPRLVLVSAGSVDSNRVMGLESTVLIDGKFTIGGMYGSRGTPSGVLIGADGKIESALAVGAPAVLELLSGDAEEEIAVPQAAALRADAR
jgi:thiol-disulfide isomerase/thioredoxin